MSRRAAACRLRALLITAVVLSLAAAGHLAAGGAPPPALPMLGLGAGLLGPVARVARRTLRLPRVLALLGATQLGLHEIFTAWSIPADCPAGGHGHHLPPAPGPSCLPGTASGAGHHGLDGTGVAMLAGHVAAVLLTAVVISTADNALEWALAWLRPLVAGPRPPRLPLGFRQGDLPPAQRPRVRWRGLRRDRVRGPPALWAPRRTCWG
ncbi:hypothetical protein GMA12_08225 [Kocuria sediminis]|uniref:MFS transporter n=1 Tax=Kocuria sediminis TaxID=1038857 RepID=A0A6N8GQA7_9MICC|nr:hypothetical protein [Kocuria sediminis]MUN63125.1 hypothetical protein [Kocuria sediminis]